MFESEVPGSTPLYQQSFFDLQSEAKNQFDPDFNLGIGEWIGEGDNAIAGDYATLAAEGSNSGVDNDDNRENVIVALSIEESRKWKCLSLKRTDKRKAIMEPGEQFCVTTENEMTKSMKGVAPMNTETSTKWAVKNFTDWAIDHNKIDSSNPVPSDLLKSYNTEKFVSTFASVYLKLERLMARSTLQVQ